MNRLACGIVIVAVGSVATAARGQVPFFFPGTTSFEPQIGIVESGVGQDVQAVVSADRKYVTLNMRVTNSQLLALRSFTFLNGAGAAQNNPPLGIVGLPPTNPAPPRKGGAKAGAAAATASASPVLTSPSEIKRAVNRAILERQGMYRIADAD